MQQVVADEVYQGCQQNLARANERTEAHALHSSSAARTSTVGSSLVRCKLPYLAIAIHLLLWVPEEDEICSENRDRQGC